MHDSERNEQRYELKVFLFIKMYVKAWPTVAYMSLDFNYQFKRFATKKGEEVLPLLSQL